MRGASHPRMSQSNNAVGIATEPAGSPGAARAQLRTLWHYRPDYDYRPDLFTYTELHTTDPDYVVVGVAMMVASVPHNRIVDQLVISLRAVARGCVRPIHVSREAGISRIPGHMWVSAHHTGTLGPDLSVWAGPAQADPPNTYQYGRDGVPLLVVEVVSHATQQERARDWDYKWHAYARMGIPEYWLLDTEQAYPLIGYTLDAGAEGMEPRAEYRPLAVSADNGQPSRVLGTALRWREDDTLEWWHDAWGRWVAVEEIPDIEARLQADARGAQVDFTNHLQLLLGMGVTRSLALELGLDLLGMDTLPGVRALGSTQGDLGQLRRHIPPRPPEWGTSEDRDYVVSLLRTGPHRDDSGQF